MWEEVIFSLDSRDLPSDDTVFEFAAQSRNIQNSNLGNLVNLKGLS